MPPVFEIVGRDGRVTMVVPDFGYEQAKQLYIKA